MLIPWLREASVEGRRQACGGRRVVSGVLRVVRLPMAFVFAVAQGALVALRVRSSWRTDEDAPAPPSSAELVRVFRQTVRDAMGETWAKGED